MKKHFLLGVAFAALVAASPAIAADMPVKAPIYKAPVVDPWNWTGFYVGGNVGYSWGRSATDATFSAPPLATQSRSSSFSMDGWLGGLQIGANWQNNNFVWGVEADIQAAGQKGDTNFSCVASLCTNSTFVITGTGVVSSTYSQKLDWFGTARLRGGFTVTPTILAYATGGLAWGHIKTDGTLSGVAAGSFVSAPFSDSTTKLGWTIGAGLEGRISGNWTAKIEYLYMDLGHVDTTATLLTNVPPLTANFSSKITDNILRVGMNYKFN
jgi:outer membrane immunogenic protein